MSQPDIEVYVKGPSAEQIQGWLKQQFDCPEIHTQSTRRHACLASWQGKNFEVIVLPKLQNGHTSIWPKHAYLP